MRSKCLLVLILFLLESCSSDSIAFESYKSPENAAWSLSKPIELSFEQEDLNRTYEVLMHVRHNQSYSYSNLFLFREIFYEGKRQFGDTMEIQLADVYGRWHGEGIGSIKQLDFPFKRSLMKLDGQGKYQFIFTHGMRTEILEGVESIGLTFKNVDPE